jgi:hypothetical protein
MSEIPDEPRKRPLFIAAKHLPVHILLGVKALRKWDDLFDVSDAELEAAVHEVENIRLG